MKKQRKKSSKVKLGKKRYIVLFEHIRNSRVFERSGTIPISFETVEDAQAEINFAQKGSEVPFGYIIFDQRGR